MLGTQTSFVNRLTDGQDDDVRHEDPERTRCPLPGATRVLAPGHDGDRARVRAVGAYLFGYQRLPHERP
jgi:hypothetical protein